MTYTTSSMVMAVSAMLVASTILRTPGGGRWNALRCSEDATCVKRGLGARKPQNPTYSEKYRCGGGSEGVQRGFIGQV
eukprot:1184303-Prorocentrum_minimum.AAC.2